MIVPRRVLHEMNVRLFAKALLASRLAKTVDGPVQRRLYRIKGRSLGQLIRHADDPDVQVGVDRERFPGLLSVRMTGLGALHTHENWMDKRSDLALQPRRDSQRTRRRAGTRQGARKSKGGQRSARRSQGPECRRDGSAPRR